MEIPGGFKPVAPWFRRWWGVLLITIGASAIGVALIVLALTGYYWLRIRSGHGAELARQFSGSFTVAGASQATRGPIDTATLEGSNEPTKGLSSAPLTVVEFVDFKCPNCKAAMPILQQLVQKYGRQVRLIVRDFPVETLHPGATELAQVAWCAGQQGRFWQAHDWLYTHQDELAVPISPTDIEALANATSLDKAKLNTCRVSPAASQKVRADYFAAASLGVRGTPTFFLNNTKIEGVIPWQAWEQVLLPLAR
jgi:protein-disulfide isomerase